MSDTILAFDLGTGGNKASLYDAEGRCLASVFVPYETQYPQAGWHEQRPESWWDSVVAGTRQLLKTGAADPRSIACLAVSGHSLGCVPLAADGSLLRPTTPIWSDKRPVEQAARFFRRIDPSRWYHFTGNGFPAPHYTIFKILWYRDHEPEMFRRVQKIVGTKDYVNYKLTGRLATDYSYASGCGAYDLLAWDYSDELLAAAELPRSLLPEIVPSQQVLGELTAEAAEQLGLPRRVKVACGGVDNSCMALGARNIAQGRGYASLGSSSWIAVSSNRPLLDNAARPYVFTHVIPGMFTSAVAIFSSGTSLKWVRDRLCVNVAAGARLEDKDPYDAMTALAAQSPVGAKGLLFNPSLAGGSSLDASPNIRGALLGLDLGHTQADVVRATLEGIALNLRLVLDELRRLGPVGHEMVVVGGGSRSKIWRQIFADAWEIEILKTNVGQDAGSLGAAAVAAVAAGLWDDFGRIDQVHELEDRAVPCAENVAVYRQLLPIFRQSALDQSRLGDLLAQSGVGGRSGGN
jgi:xylulokinase